MFTIDISNRIIIEPDLLAIDAFKSIWDSDTTKDKINAYKELKYVYFVADVKSPYKQSTLDTEELKEKVTNDFMDKGWKESKLVTKAIEKYKELQYSKALQALDSADNALAQVTNLLKTFKIDTSKDSRSQMEESKNLLDLINKIPETATRLEVARKRVEQDIKISDKSSKGKNKINVRELPKNKRN